MSDSPGLSPDSAYYVRQVILPDIGPEGQARLSRARVLVIGAGGLGSPLLMALAGAGVGTITVLDQDTVSPSNLNRQFLYTAADIGKPKATLARERLQAYHPDLVIEARAESLTEALARDMFPAQDLIVAAVDNRETRQLINRICYELGKPWIDGGVRGFSGYAAAFEPGLTPCYDCCFDLGPAGPKKAAEPSGAIGATASVIGSLEANLVIIRLLGLPDPLGGQLLLYHGRTLDFTHLAIEKRDDCPICGGK